jgi:dTDP-4-dehydrorhamnose reductase
MKIAVIGANGQLGSDVVRAFTSNGDDVYPLTHSDIELSDIDSIFHSFRDIQPNVVVNTAAMHHVENCELKPEKAYAVNALGSRNLAIVARDTKCVLMHVSTDYVFDGAKLRPYDENDTPHPLNVYGNSKLAGEHFVRSVAERHFILRTSALYGNAGCRAKGGLNFIHLMLKLAKERNQLRVVDTEVVSPTSTAELARQMVALSRSDCYGLYHATAEGSCSWFEFAQTIFAMTGTKANLMVAGPDEFPTKVPRPKYSVLENAGLKSNGLNHFESWQSALHAYLNQPVHNLAHTA